MGNWVKGYPKKIFFCVMVAVWILFVSNSYANSSQGNANEDETWSIEKVDPLDNIDCAKMIKMGIEKQVNLRASRIRIHCGLEHPRQQLTLAESTLSGSLFTPWAIGGIDVNVTGTTSSYEWDSVIWGNGNTIFVAYNTSSSAICAGGSYGHGSYSTDGGATFARLCPNPFATGHGINYGDPMVIYNQNLSKWYAVFLATGCGGQGIGVWESTDSITWTTGACAHSGTSDDRESMWVDNNPGSPFYGRMYISWNDFAVGQYIFVTYSDNGTTWSAPVQATTSFIRNVQTTVSPGTVGTVFIAGMNEGGGGGASRINLMYRSTDGGVTWANVYTGPSFAPPGSTTCPGNPYFSAVVPLWRYMGWGQPAVGPAGTVHYIYAGAGATGDYGDIYYIRSTDNGATWSVPIRLNTDTTTQTQWMPSLTATSWGQVLASWYDRRNTTDGQNYERWGRISNDGGASWQNDDVISDVISPQFNQTVCGTSAEFESANGSVALLTWNDGRITPLMEIFFDQVQLCATVTAIPTHPNQITVYWNAVAGASCYNVYRSNGACPGSTFMMISSCQIGTAYMDNSVSGGSTYSYKITSMPSNCVSSCADATAFGNCILPPTFAGAAAVVNNSTTNCGLTVQWAAGTSQCSFYPTLSYTVYKSTDPAFVPGPANQLATCIAGTTYLDSAVTVATTYYYAVRAEDSRPGGGTGPCNGGDFETNTVKLSNAPYGPQTVLLNDNAGDSGPAVMVLGTGWTNITTQNHTPGGTHSYWSGTGVNNACTYLTSPSLSLTGGAYYFLEYWTYYYLETLWDGVDLQVSSNGGTTYNKVTPLTGYTGTLQAASASCVGANQTAYTGNFQTWTYANANLAAYAGNTILFRFRYGTDSGLTYNGFWVDDIKTTAKATCTTTDSSKPGEALALTITKSGTNLSLVWSAPGGACLPTAYGVYRGTLPWTGYNHASIDCSITATSTTSPQQSESNYYLVVAQNQNCEGSYGKNTAGTERPQGLSPCYSQQCLSPCN